jgi:WD40 repeat protein
MSWDPSIATIKRSNTIDPITWSPCSRFIAIGQTDSMGEVQILDAITFKQLKSFVPPHSHTKLLTFCPESHSLMWVGHGSGAFITWDLQTGVLDGEIPIGEGGPADCVRSITHSQCGTMFGVLFDGYCTTAINTYDVLSSTPIHYHPIEGWVVRTIWTHGECLRYAIFELRSITIWEVGFASSHPPTLVESLPGPDNFDPTEGFLFLPTHSRFAFILHDTAFVWDAQHSKLLLHSVDAKDLRGMTFSSDGCFFACGTSGRELYLWKESPAGYILHQKLMYSGISHRPLLSPNGQSIITSSFSTLRLWHTMDSTTSPSTLPTQGPRPTERFILGFSPDGSLVAVGRSAYDTATVLNLTSGSPWLTINTDMEIYGLWVTGSTLGIVGDGKIVTWNLLAEDGVLGADECINDGVQTTTFDCSALDKSIVTPFTSISPDFNYLAIIGLAVTGLGVDGSLHLGIHDLSTGKCLAETQSMGHRPWFTPDGCEVWSGGQPEKFQGWAIVRDSGSDLLKLEELESTQYPPEGCPWRSPHGYNITDDGWILDPDEKRLLWLPSYWRLGEIRKEWSGRFLAFLVSELPEAGILEFLED